jgi:hypothetical protein
MATNNPGNDSSWLFNIAMENGLFIDGLPIKMGGFSMAMEMKVGVNSPG